MRKLWFLLHRDPVPLRRALTTYALAAAGTVVLSFTLGEFGASAAVITDFFLGYVFLAALVLTPIVMLGPALRSSHED